MEQPRIITPDEADGLEPWPGFADDFARRAIEGARADPETFVEHLSTMLRLLEGWMKPIIPEGRLRRALVADFLAGGGTPEQLEKIEAAFFRPPMTLAMGLRFKGEVEAAIRGGVEGAVQMDVLSRFLTDACDLAPTATCIPADLFGRFCAWADESGVAAGGKHAFYRSLGERLPGLRRGRPIGADGKQSSQVHFIGIGIK